MTCSMSSSTCCRGTRAALALADRGDALSERELPSDAPAEPSRCATRRARRARSQGAALRAVSFIGTGSFSAWGPGVRGDGVQS